MADETRRRAFFQLLNDGLDVLLFFQWETFEAWVTKARDFASTELTRDGS